MKQKKGYGMSDQTKVSNRTKYSYAISGIGRDMIYALYGTYLIVFFTDALGLPDWELVMDRACHRFGFRFITSISSSSSDVFMAAASPPG